MTRNPRPSDSDIAGVHLLQNLATGRSTPQGAQTGNGPVAASEVTFRGAIPEDLPTLVGLLANDPLGSLREDPHQQDLASYRQALAAIDADPNHHVLVAVSSGSVVGMLQLSFLPHLTYWGGWRAQIEGVRVAEHARSEGLGRRLVAEAIARAEIRGCHLVQLTTDRQRPDALPFYESLGFQATHDGMKLHLDRGTA